MRWEELKTHLHRDGNDSHVNFEVEGIAFALEYMDIEGTVLLSAEFGVLSEDASGEMILREMLEANHMFAGTSGASLSVDPHTMQASIQQQIWIDFLDFDAFMIRMKMFVDVAKDWKQKISNALEATPVMGTPSPWTTNEGFILV